MISLIVAVAENGVIGDKGRIPWHLTSDLARFKQLTSGNTIVMGRKTFESIGRALPNRRNIVVTRNKDFPAVGYEVAMSLNEALRLAGEEEEIFVIGGAEIFKEALPKAGRLYLTKVQANPKGDVYFPNVDLSQWQLKSSEKYLADQNNDHPFTFLTYER